MSRLIVAIALACAFAVSACAMNPALAGPKHARADSQTLAFCAADASYRLVCPRSAVRVVGHARRNGRHADANGNPISRREAGAGARRGLCRRGTAAGDILVACDVADRMAGFIADVVARGFKGRVHCFALGGHVRRSLHYRGEAWTGVRRGRRSAISPMSRSPAAC